MRQAAGYLREIACGIRQDRVALPVCLEKGICGFETVYSLWTIKETVQRG